MLRVGAAALRGEIELAALRTHVAPHTLFANPIVWRGADEVNAGVQFAGEKAASSLTTRTYQILGPRRPKLPLPAERLAAVLQRLRFCIGKALVERRFGYTREQTQRYL